MPEPNNSNNLATQNPSTPAPQATPTATSAAPVRQFINVETSSDVEIFKGVTQEPLTTEEQEDV